MSTSESYTKILKRVFSRRGVSSGRMYTFHPNAPYLYYIMSDPETKISGFYEYDYSNPTSSKPRRIAEDILGAPTKKLSKEEELLRERTREYFTGVTTYTFNPKTLDFLIPFGRTLIIYNVAEPANPKIRVVWEGCTEPRLDPKLSSDGRFVSYVYDSDLWILPLCNDSASEKPVKVTDSKARPNFTCACADYILEEEFDLYTGYFVCPTCQPGRPNEYRILYFEDDSNDVDDYVEYSDPSSDKPPEVQKYPRVGTPNPLVTLCMMDLAISTDGAVNVLRVGRVDKTLCGLYPNAEYFARLGWCRDGQRVYIQVLDRRQRNLDVVFIKADAFFGSEKDFGNAVTVAKKQTDEHWINIFDMFEELEDGSFIWASEEHPNGFMRLVRLIPGKKDGAPYECVNLFESSESLYAVNDSITIDEKSKLIAFLGYENPPLQKRCFVVSYESGDSALVKRPVRVSSDKLSVSSFGAKFAADGKSAVFVFEQSSTSTAPLAVVSHVDFVPDESSCGCTVDTKPIDTLFASKCDSDLICPQMFDFVSKRHHEHLYGCYFAPKKPMCEKCPVVVSIYGGTHCKLVNDEYTTAFKEQRQLYAASGMYVVCLDNVGSFNRGHKFESYIDEKMGTIEIDDQIEALHYLAEDLKLPIDLSRVAVFGWSYGGYMSLMAIAQHPEVFKVSLVGAPVTFWEAYDTGYTERYMGIPTTDKVKEAYKAGSVFTYIDGIPKDKARIAIVHGLSDENVHFEHTQTLVEKFKSMGVPFEIRTYPGQRHCFRNIEDIIAYQSFYLEFLLKNI